PGARRPARSGPGPAAARRRTRPAPPAPPRRPSSPSPPLGSSPGVATGRRARPPAARTGGWARSPTGPAARRRSRSPAPPTPPPGGRGETVRAGAPPPSRPRGRPGPLLSRLDLHATPDQAQVSGHEAEDDDEQDDGGGRRRVGVADRRAIAAPDVGAEDRLHPSGEDQRQLEDPEGVDRAQDDRDRDPRHQERQRPARQAAPPPAPLHPPPLP